MPRVYPIYQQLANVWADTSVTTAVDWGTTTNAVTVAQNTWTNTARIYIATTANTYQAITYAQYDQAAASAAAYREAERRLLWEARHAGAITPAAAARMEAETARRMLQQLPVDLYAPDPRTASPIQRESYAAVIVRARALLDSMLTPDQQAQLQRDHFFVVEAPRTRNRYRIRYGTHGNVRLLDKHNREIRKYCAQPLDVPTEDSMLAQKLMIETDEDAFLRVANASAA